MTPLPSQQELRQIFGYDPDTGALWFRDVRTWGGKIVATSHAHRDGYRVVRMPGTTKWLRSHRIVWKWMTGEEPAADVDHINGDKADNRWENLRLATRSQNMANRARPRCKRSDLPKGVVYCKRTGKYRAAITVNYRSIKLGRFATAEEAHKAYSEALQKHFGEFARAA